MKDGMEGEEGVGKWTRDLEHKLDLVLSNVFLADGSLPALELLHVTFHILTDSASTITGSGQVLDKDGQNFSQLILKLHFAKDD